MIAGEGTEKRNLVDRLRGAIWGQFVGDAAALGTHWIYDLAKQKAKFPGGVRGFEKPLPNHYHAGKSSGDQTHYGDAALLLAKTMAEDGGFDPRSFGRRFVNTFRDKTYSGYLDHATRDTVQIFDQFTERSSADEFDFQQGADDDQLATASRLASVVVRYWRDPNLPSIVESLARVCQNNDLAIGCALFSALFLAKILDGLEVSDALVETQNEAIWSKTPSGLEIVRLSNQGVQHLPKDVIETTLELGQSCPLEHSFPSAIHAFLRHSDSFETAILETVKAGGDNAGRAALIGAWLAGRLGFSGIPRDWCNRLSHAEEIADATEKILKLSNWSGNSQSSGGSGGSGFSGGR